MDTIHTVWIIKTNDQNENENKNENESENEKEMNCWWCSPRCWSDALPIENVCMNIEVDLPLLNVSNRKCTE